jgi:3-methyl-2-oxobutanoate hydroxymethyltransferase
MEAMMRVTVRDIQQFKERGERFVMLTCYDSTSARLLDEAEIPLIFIGDTLGEVMLGYSSTVPVTMEEMLHHAKSVTRVVENAFVVGDLPFMAYQVSIDEGMNNAGRMVKEAGTNCVKLEGASPSVIELVSRLVDAGVPVMGHLGLTPQSIHQLGGHRVQGRDETTASRILGGARKLQDSGAFAVVLEAVPAPLATEVTRSLTIPTIGIGAGPDCDGQVLVFHDFLGITPYKVGKFVKEYATLGPAIVEASRRFTDEVSQGIYPGPEHSYR